MRVQLKTALVASAVAAILLFVAAGSYALDVLVNQTGYERYGPKTFRVQRTTDYGGNGTFIVKAAGTGADISSGPLVRKGNIWDKWYWEGDFSSLTIDGDYYISATVDAETNTSYAFNVGVGSLLNGTGAPTYQYFTAQRCGTAVSFTYKNRAGQMVNWSHNLCHTDDGYIYPSGPYLDTAGGWHDSGEYQKYSQFFGGHAVFDLLTLYDSNRSYFDGIDTNSNGIADILDEATWQARWLAKMTDGNGHVMRQISKRRSGASWVKPEDDTDRIIGTSDDRWVEIGDDNTPTEIIVCASLIRTHLVLASKGLPTENFAAKALAIWDHRVALAISEGGHNNLGAGGHHVRAGLDLYTVYGQQNCWDRSVQRIDEMANGCIANPAVYDGNGEEPGYELAAMAYFARTYPTVEPQASLSRTAIQALMSHNIYLANNPIGLIRRDEGGQLIYFPANPDLGLNRLYGLVAWGAVEAYKTIGDASYLRFALDQYNWILGANYFRTCMMEAVGDSYVNKYHTRYDTFIANGIEPGVVINGYIRDGSGLPWLDFGTGSVSAQTNESWLPNSAGYAAGLAALSAFATSNQSPYSGVINLPGVIQAENYDVGGESIAYRDTGAGNSGGAYRSDNVDVEACGEGGYDVAFIETGEWLDYTVNVPSPGAYDFNMRVASPSGGSFHIEMNGQNVCGLQSVPNTGGWQNWATVNTPGVNLSAGQQVLTVYVDSGGWNFNYLQVGAPAPWNDAQYISDTIPNTMTAGQQYPVTVTMKNIGTSTWTQAAGYKLGAAGDSDPFCAFNRVDLSGGDSIGPNQQKTFSFTMTAPTTPATYTTDWRMLREGVEWFGQTLTEQVQVNGVATTVSNSTFDSDANGWSIVVWKAGSGSDGTMAWTSGVGNPGGAMRGGGVGATDNNDRCTREGGEIYKVIPTVGFQDIQVSYDLKVSALGAAYTGGGIGGCAVDHNVIDEQITVFYSTNGGANWTEAEYLLRDALLAGYQSYGTRTIDLSSIPACDENPNFALRFRWQFNHTSDTGDLDNIVVRGIGQPDTTAPGPVTSFTATPGDTQNGLSWVNPGDADLAGVMIRFKTTGYPTGPTDGTQCYSGLGTSTTHTGLTNGTTYYYAAYAYDEVPNYSTAAQASGIPADTTPPGDVTGFTVTPGDTQNSLSWTNPGGDFTGTKIMFKTTGYPTGPADGTQIYDSSGTSTTHTSLTNGVTYYYKAFAHDEVPNYAAGVQGSGVPADTTAPGPVTGFTATPGDTQNSLNWTNPGGDFTGTKILFKTTGYPTGPTDGTTIYDAAGTSTNHTGVTNGTTYYYAAYAHDEVPNYASAAQASAVPADTTAPGPVTGFAATPGDTQNSLSWTNPGGDFTGTKILFKTTGYPTGPTDGTTIYDAAGTSTAHTGLINGTTYYYAAYAHDEVPNYASAAQASGTPVSGGTISNSTFDADLDGWTVTLWKWGADYGTMAWSSGAGNPGGAVRASGAGASDNTDRCTREGGDLTKIISTVGSQDIQVAYDLRVNSLGADMTGGGSGSCAVDHNLIDEQLTVSYSTNGGGSWTEVEYLLRSALLASYQTYGRRTIDLSSVPACDNNPNFMLKFRWQNNSAADLCDLDNITVACSTGDTTPPGNVTGFAATPGPSQNSLSWTNPTDPDFAGVMIRFRTDTYPTGPTDGTECYNGTGTSTIHSGLTNGTTYYYKAFAYDEVPNYASGATASGVPAPVTISSSTFNSSADGWTITTWRAGTQGYGTMTWLSSGAGNPGGGMRCSGASTTDNTDRCAREGGEISKIISTVGYSNIKVSYGLDVNALGNNRTGAGTGTCTVDHNLVDEQITVFYSTNGGSGWTEAEWIKRSTLKASYQAWGARVIDLTGVSAANNNPNFMLRFRWQVNTTGDQANLDNIVVTAN
ncbi:MAG: glycoside hydrolase family 9 protein [Armatimonadota bacterium]|nr:glycoside hydrolase family 9 protein [Armatimonadota bacterium]